MAATIILKKSSTAAAVPAAGSLQPGELAVNLADAKLYTKRVDGTVILVGTGSAGASVSVQATPPSGPSAGALWWDTTYGCLKIYYDDGTSAQWVDAYTGAVGGSGGGGVDNSAVFAAIGGL